jgi:ABC-2 type transport system permease protein
MFGTIAAFELRYQLRSPVFWVGALLFFLMAFGATTSDSIQIGARGNVHVNAPFIIVQTLAVMGVFGIFVSTAFVAGAVIRDDETGFAPILRATRVQKADYVLGRFTGATAVAFVVMAAAAAGIGVGSFMPWLDPAQLGPPRLLPYLWALLAFALPTLLVTASGFFALAIATRSLMWTYVGAVAALVLFVITRALLRDPAYDTAAALADPFGFVALNIATKYWTAADRNTLLPPLTGLLLANRALWLLVSGLLLALAYRVFRMDGAPLWRRRPRATPADAAQPAAPARKALPAARPAAARRAQFWAVMRFDAASVFRSPAFFVLMAIGIFNAWGGLWFSTRQYGTEVFPVTRLMVKALQDSFSIIPLIIAVFYAGELVWRERQQRMHEIVDATVAPDWVHLLPKIAAVVGVLVAAGLAGIATAVVVQAVRGWTTFEIGHYALWYLLPQTVGAALVAVLAVFVQTLVPHKMIGWAVMLVYVVATLVLNALGFEHNLYLYAGTPEVPLSDMNGQGHFWVSAAWFQAYWSACALVLVVLAYALRRRGAESSLRQRLARLPQRLRGGAGLWLAAGSLAWAGLGGWIFYNTNVLNRYETRPEREALLARYEKALLPFEKLPQPTITDVTLKVELFPKQRRALAQGQWRIENRTSAPLQHVHLRWMRPLQMRQLQLPGAVLEKSYDEFDYRIYRFEPALQPGESRQLDFATELHDVAFRNDNGQRRLVDNGSFIDSFEIAPLIGINRAQLLQDRAKRRKQGLQPELRMAPLEDESARAHHYLRNDSDWVNASITLVTDADQVPVAPGAVVSDTTAGGRRTLVTRTEAPIQHFFSLQSGRYAVKSVDHAGVKLTVYHHPQHDANVQRMLDAMAASIDLFSGAFSPYQFRQARILEFPAYASFAQAFAGTIPYSEGIGFVTKHEGEDKIDMVTYVTAHEIAHQWWGHQVIGADQQGSTLLSESFAQYSALLVMEKLYGKEQIRRFLKYELDRYLRSRGGELIEELPLARVENQPYIHYQKGSLAMYWLKEVVGEAVVNRALQRLLQQHAFKPAPYPRSTDFLRLLREEAGPAHDALITDLFERIVLVDAKATAARATKRADGRWDLVLDVEARKLQADGKGAETEQPLDEPFDIGVFSDEPGKKGFKPASVLLMERRRISSGTQRLTLVVDRQPRWAGIDPYNKRIDRNSDDNLKKVDMP